MNIVFIASEMAPYAKTGGLADVLCALPPAIKERGHAVSVILPFYRSVAEHLKSRILTDIQITVKLGNQNLIARIWEATASNGVRLFLVQRDEFFDRSYLYGNVYGDYEDSAARFVFFSKVAVELLRYIEPHPDIVHLHDWQTGLIPGLIRAQGLPVKTVFTVHNLAYQGNFWSHDFALSNLDASYFTPRSYEFFERFNLMKGAILMAHQVTTVSPQYALEIQTPDLGCGLHQVLLEHSFKLSGILNGINLEDWDPEKDKHLNQCFSLRRMTGKVACKSWLQKKLKLEEKEVPLFACIARLASQKGYDLMAKVLDDFLAQHDVQMVFMGEGDQFYQNYLEALQKKFKSKVKVLIEFNETLSHQIVAGADFFLVPSRYEPCGLTQMYSQRYGTIPVVHAVGGLKDTVTPWKAETGEGTGLVFHAYEPAALNLALKEALHLYAQKEQMTLIRKKMMSLDFSWDRSAEKYETVYQRALAS
ncbi:MAG: glycogen synthase GlgA [Verrucomicrobiota bacterium]